jgi:hypothetical protein
VHKPYSAFFVGIPTAEEQDIIQNSRLLVDFAIIANAEEGAKQILQIRPDYVMLPLTYSDRTVLHSFHCLRKDGRTCVIVWGEKTLTAFSGRGYRWRKSAPKTLAGLEGLMEWGKWPLPVNRRINNLMFSPCSV